MGTTLSGPTAASAPGLAHPAPPALTAPPMGSSPATSPVENMGHEVKAFQAAHMITNAIAMAIPLAGSSSPLGKALSKALVEIGREIPQGAVSQMGQQNELMQQMLRARQMQAQEAALHQRAMQQQMAAGPTGLPPGTPAAP